LSGYTRLSSPVHLYSNVTLSFLRALMHSFYLFMYLFIYFMYSFIYSFIYLFMYSFIYSVIYNLFMHWFICFFIYSFIYYLFIHLFMHLCIYLFVCLFIYIFIFYWYSIFSSSLGNLLKFVSLRPGSHHFLEEFNNPHSPSNSNNHENSIVILSTSYLYQLTVQELWLEPPRWCANGNLFFVAAISLVILAAISIVVLAATSLVVLATISLVVLLLSSSIKC
jgi:hypothetical protein